MYQCLIQIQLTPKGRGPFFSTAQENPRLFLNIFAAELTPNITEHNSIIFEQLYRELLNIAFLLLRAMKKIVMTSKGSIVPIFLLRVGA